jgi:hypothetical protein
MGTVNEKVKRPKENWEVVTHHVYPDVCKEEVATNNRHVQILNTTTRYANLVTNFNTSTKINYDKKEMKK